ncbi:MAG: redoxin domain-containing protein, partial [Chloroflexota bacterium]|nr:redoxin domain-containing protein [Chloroflexota bacterium]
LGINHGAMASHQRFADKLGLPFPLLVDEGLVVAGQYGAVKPEGGSIKRTVVIVGVDGMVRYWKQGMPSDAELLEVLGKAQ